jgi:acid phosphatase (class A)
MFRVVVLFVAGICIATGCSSIDSTAGSSSRFLGSPGPLPGYLEKGQYPDSSALLPPPPAPDSPGFLLDEQLNRKFLELRDTARWDLAAKDAVTRFPESAGTFSCAFGVRITAQDTPHLYVILQRSFVDVGMSVRPAKKRYQRPRPFVVNEKPVCTPTALRYLNKDGSYPSGHSTTGWAWALILAEINPDRIDALLDRGWEFGQSRAICNVHWQSDVAQGRGIGAALVARLHGNQEFRDDMEAARHEVGIAQSEGWLPNRDCEWEARALKLSARTDQLAEL